MFRTLASLGGLLLLGLPTQAQVIRANRPPPQPAGFIPPVQLPVANPASARPSPPMRPFRPGLFPNYGPFGLGGYFPYYDWPTDYDRPPTAVNNYIPVPTVAPAPAPPPELRARLTLDVPANAQVWLAGQAVDAAAVPVILESPVLRAGQTYTFDVKVAWREGDKIEERTRSVTVEAGRGATVTYFGG